MTDTTGLDPIEHPCPHPVCGQVVPFSILACRRHWRELPKPLQNEVWRAWRGVQNGAPGAVGRHDRAVADCVAFWTQSLGGIVGTG